MSHITCDGFANLARLESECGYAIEELPSLPAIFGLIQATGRIDDTEMFRVFNMGVGFAVVVAEPHSQTALDAIEASGYSALRLGTVTDEPGVKIKPRALTGVLEAGDSRFFRSE